MTMSKSKSDSPQKSVLFYSLELVSGDGAGETLEDGLTKDGCYSICYLSMKLKASCSSCRNGE